MPLHDTSYQHWEGVHCGLWHRRWVIARNGVATCLQNKWMRHLVVLCWVGGLVMTALLFLVGQLLVADSIVVLWVGNLNPNLQSFARMLTTWLEQHPEVSVRTTQDVLFFYFATLLMPMSIFALGMALPLLITRDLASNAIIIYSSKAVSRGDYLLGKFATAFGLLALTWLGPVCAAWLVGNLLAPDWRFFWHARVALGHALVYGLTSMCLLSVLAMGVSALSSKEKTTPAFWFMYDFRTGHKPVTSMTARGFVHLPRMDGWVLGGIVANIAAHTQPWLRHVSFTFNLDQVALAVFRLGDDLKIAQDNVPIFGNMLRNIRPETMTALNSPALTGALLGLLCMAAAAALLLRNRVKPE